MFCITSLFITLTCICLFVYLASDIEVLAVYLYISTCRLVTLLKVCFLQES